VKDAYVGEEAGGDKREHGFAEAAKARDEPLGRSYIDGGPQTRHNAHTVSDEERDDQVANPVAKALNVATPIEGLGLRPHSPTPR
jgi:hypothetical protein